MSATKPQLLLLLIVAACSRSASVPDSLPTTASTTASSTAKTAASALYRPAYRDGPFWYVDFFASAAELPARFGGGFPKIGEPIYPWPRSGLPRPALEARIEEGDAATRRAFEVWLRDASSRVDKHTLRLDYGRFLNFADTSWMREWRAREKDVRVLAILNEFLQRAAKSASDDFAPSKPTPVEKVAFTKALDEATALELRTELTSMAMRDRPLALKAARALVSRGPTHPFLTPVTRALVDFENPGSFEAWLVEQDLCSARASAPPWLEAALGRLPGPTRRWFTYEATEGNYEALLYGAARTTGLALADLQFEDLAPEDAGYADALASISEMPAAEHPPRILVAYGGGKAYRALADGSRYRSTLDTTAALGLLNAILRERAAQLRLVSVLTDGAVVVAGPERGLRDAIQRKLLLTDPGPEAAELVEQERQELERSLELP